MNLGDYRERVRELTGVRMDTLLSDEALDGVINEAYLHVCLLADWTFLRLHTLEPVSADVEQLELPADMAAVATVFVEGPARRRLRYRSNDQLDRIPAFDMDGVATWAWTHHDDRTLRLFPVPTVPLDVTLRGWRRAAPLAAPADEPMFDAEFHPIVSFDAAQRVLVAEGDDSRRSELYQREAISYLARMGHRYQLEDPEEPVRVYIAGLPSGDEPVTSGGEV